MNHPAAQKSKLLHLEIMRIFAVYFVIFNHTSGSGYMLFTHVTPGSWRYWVYLILSIFCKVSVPLFLMISGALLLKKDPERLDFLFRKRILKMCILLFVVSLLYYLRDMMLTPDSSYGIRNFFKTIYSDTTSRHLWYLYMYLAFLFILPFLQALVKNLKDEYFVYMILISFATSCVTLMELVLFHNHVTLNTHFSFTWVPDIILYPCVGYYMENRLEITKKNTALLGALNIACLACSAFWTYYYMVHPSSDLKVGVATFHKRFVLINAISMFMLIKYLSQYLQITPRISKFLLSMGSCTFGIYLIHKAVMASRYHNVVMDFLKRIIPGRMLPCLVFCLVVLLISYLLTLILKKIPIIKDYL